MQWMRRRFLNRHPEHERAHLSCPQKYRHHDIARFFGVTHPRSLSHLSLALCDGCEASGSMLVPVSPCSCTLCRLSHRDQRQWDEWILGLRTEVIITGDSQFLCEFSYPTCCCCWKPSSSGSMSLLRFSPSCASPKFLLLRAGCYTSGAWVEREQLPVRVSPETVPLISIRAFVSF